MEDLGQTHGLLAPLSPYALMGDPGGGNSDLHSQTSYFPELAQGNWLQGIATNEVPYTAELGLLPALPSGQRMPGSLEEGAYATLDDENGGAAIPPEWAGITTVMMRNIPNKYTQRMLLTEINCTGFLGSYDFLYLPIDPETNANRGYAFLNFIGPSFAWMFKMSYEGNKMNRFNSNKVVSVVPATLQGFEANYAHYASARVNRGDPAARPLFLREPSQPGLTGAPGAGVGGGRAAGVDRRAGRQRRGGGGGGPGAAGSGVGPGGLEQLLAAQAQVGAQSISGSPAFAGAGSQPPGFWPGALGMSAGCLTDAFLGGAENGDAVPGSVLAPSPGLGSPREAKAAARAGGAGACAAAGAGAGAAAGVGAGAGAGAAASPMVPKYCPHCGAPIQPTFQFCPQCGASLNFSADLGLGGLA